MDKLSGIEGLAFRDNPHRRETQVLHQGKHIYTLHRGASAFFNKGQARGGRMMVGKHGSNKEYVLDDQGVPTRRYAHAIKDDAQMNVLGNKQSLVGRFVTPLQAPAIYNVRGSDKPPHQNIRAHDVQHSAQKGQERFDWSTAKNRELFIRSLNQRNIVKADEPSKLQRMTYYDAQHRGPGRGKRIEADIKRELAAAKPMPEAAKRRLEEARARLHQRIKVLRDKRTGRHSPPPRPSQVAVGRRADA